jgi:phosphohistidine phosphatase
MKSLTIVRHAKSSWKDRGLSDRERPLNKRGNRDAPVMGKRVADAGIRPSQIISSPAVRAWTTAKIFAKELGYPTELLPREDGLYLASLDNLLDVVATQDNGFNNLMLFGHNPGLTDFVNYLVPGLTNNLPTAGVVSVDLDCDDWMLYDRPQAELLLHDYPKKQQ